MEVGIKDFEGLLEVSAPLPPPETVSTIDFHVLDASVRKNLKVKDYYPCLSKAFENTHMHYQELVKYLRLLKLELPIDSPAPGWQELLRVWASQCCFLDAHYPNCNIRMSLETELLDNVGLVTRYVLHDDGTKPKEWITPEKYFKKQRELNDPHWIAPITPSESQPHEQASVADPSNKRDEEPARVPLPMEKQKFCMCTVIRVPDMCVPWEQSDISVTNSLTAASSLPAGSPITALISTVLSACEHTHCRFGLIADDAFTMFVTWTPPAPYDPSPAWIWYELIPAATHSTVFCIAAVLLRHSFSVCKVAYSRQVAGAPNDPPRVLKDSERPQYFRDFGLYEMENNRDLYEAFLRWKTEQYAAALEAPFVIGAELPLQRDVIPRKLEPWRCPFSWVPVPDDCVTSIYRRRSRSSEVDSLLRSNSPLVFRITDIVRANCEAFSQVFKGELGCSSSGEFAATPLCLKLFDERLFDVPSIQDYNSTTPPLAHLTALNFPDEMLRREEAVYTSFSADESDRGPYLQGLSIPHCYGFHELTVQDGTGSRTVLGFLMEYIDGVPFEDVLEELFTDDSKWKEEEKVALLKRLRNLIRILNHAHITQGDWHPKQIICIEDKSENSHMNPLDQRIDFVLLDFAFARQLDDRRIMVPRLDDVGEVWDFLAMSGMSTELTKAIGWMERDECEI